MKTNSFSKLFNIALAVSAGMFINFPACAIDFTAKSQVLAQIPTGTQNTAPKTSPSGTQTTPATGTQTPAGTQIPTGSPTPSGSQTPSGTQTPTGSPTSSDVTQSTNYSYLTPGGWLCIHNPNPRCRE